MGNLNGWIEIISLLSGIASIVIGVLAIWLSITFYRMSVSSSNEVKDSSSKINNNVEKLEMMFNTMYSDTFGMVKDTVSHMREQVDRKTVVLDMSEEINGKIKSAISEHLVDLPTENLSKDDIKDLVFNLVQESKEIENKIMTTGMEEVVLYFINRHNGLTFGSLRDKILSEDDRKVAPKSYYNAIVSLAKKGVIDSPFGMNQAEGDPISYNTPIRYQT